jgi:hypothetical protein
MLESPQIPQRKPAIYWMLSCDSQEIFQYYSFYLIGSVKAAKKWQDSFLVL